MDNPFGYHFAEIFNQEIAVTADYIDEKPASVSNSIAVIAISL